MRAPAEEYQDLWVKGRCVEKGARQCASRYELIRSFCEQYKRPFTVLDLGAHRGYFSLRLTEDFPECTAVALERDPAMIDVLEANDAERVIGLTHKLKDQQLEKLGRAEHFDVVLCLSFIHHQGGTFTKYLDLLRAAGDWLIMELALEPTASGQSVVTQSYVPEGAYMLGETPAHFGTLGPRPMFALKNHDGVRDLRQPFLGCQPTEAYRLPVESDFDRKVARWSTLAPMHKRRIDAKWVRGINLNTYLACGGAWPTRERIASLLAEAGPPPDGHGDLHPGNVILSGDRATVIDGYDQHKQVGPDEVQWERLLRHQDWHVAKPWR